MDTILEIKHKYGTTYLDYNFIIGFATISGKDKELIIYLGSGQNFVYIFDTVESFNKVKNDLLNYFLWEED